MSFHSPQNIEPFLPEAHNQISREDYIAFQPSPGEEDSQINYTSAHEMNPLDNLKHFSEDFGSQGNGSPSNETEEHCRTSDDSQLSPAIRDERLAPQLLYNPTDLHPTNQCQPDQFHQSSNATDDLYHFDPSNDASSDIRLDCQFCQRNFASLKALKLHITKSHRKLPPNEPHLLKEDSKNVSDGNRYQCNCCDRSFKSKMKLRDHMTVHNPEQRFPCSYPNCEKSFVSKKLYENHMVKHTNQARMFPCPVCDAVFTRRFHRSEHVRDQHPGIKAYPCTHPDCNHKFLSENARDNHMTRAHGGERRYRCSKCQFSASHSSLIDEHCKVAHPNLNLRQSRTSKPTEDHNCHVSAPFMNANSSPTKSCDIASDSIYMDNDESTVADLKETVNGILAALDRDVNLPPRPLPSRMNKCLPQSSISSILSAAKTCNLNVVIDQILSTDTTQSPDPNIFTDQEWLELQYVENSMGEALAGGFPTENSFDSMALKSNTTAKRRGRPKKNAPQFCSPSPAAPCQISQTEVESLYNSIIGMEQNTPNHDQSMLQGRHSGDMTYPLNDCGPLESGEPANGHFDFPYGNDDFAFDQEAWLSAQAEQAALHQNILGMSDNAELHDGDREASVRSADGADSSSAESLSEHNHKDVDYSSTPNTSSMPSSLAYANYWGISSGEIGTESLSSADRRLSPRMLASSELSTPSSRYMNVMPPQSTAAMAAMAMSAMGYSSMNSTQSISSAGKQALPNLSDYQSLMTGASNSHAATELWNHVTANANAMAAAANYEKYYNMYARGTGGIYGMPDTVNMSGHRVPGGDFRAPPSTPVPEAMPNSMYSQSQQQINQSNLFQNSVQNPYMTGGVASTYPMGPMTPSGNAMDYLAAAARHHFDPYRNYPYL